MWREVGTATDSIKFLVRDQSGSVLVRLRWSDGPFGEEEIRVALDE